MALLKGTKAKNRIKTINNGFDAKYSGVVFRLPLPFSQAAPWNCDRITKTVLFFFLCFYQFWSYHSFEVRTECHSPFQYCLPFWSAALFETKHRIESHRYSAAGGWRSHRHQQWAAAVILHTLTCKINASNECTKLLFVFHCCRLLF